MPSRWKERAESARHRKSIELVSKVAKAKGFSPPHPLGGRRARSPQLDDSIVRRFFVRGARVLGVAGGCAEVLGEPLELRELGAQLDDYLVELANGAFEVR